MSRAEYSLYIPTYSNLLTETLENYYNYTQTYNRNDTSAYDNNSDEFYNSMYWIFCKLNDLCDNDRENYGANVRAFLDKYQSALIEQQYTVNEGMTKVYEQNPVAAEDIATKIANYVAEESLGYAQELVSQLQSFISSGSDGAFMPTLLTDNVQPTYTKYFAELAEEYDIDVSDNNSGQSSIVESSQSSSSQSNSDNSSATPSTISSDNTNTSNNTPSTGDFNIAPIILLALVMLVFINKRKKL